MDYRAGLGIKNYKKTRCKNFDKGYCKYGTRCIFVHKIHTKDKYWNRKLNMYGLNYNNEMKNNLNLMERIYYNPYLIIKEIEHYL